jgi:uncharacterized membrane protein
LRLRKFAAQNQKLSEVLSTKTGKVSLRTGFLSALVFIAILQAQGRCAGDMRKTLIEIKEEKAPLLTKWGLVVYNY